MAYEKQTWKDGESGGTPITAKRLNHIEEGIAAKAERGERGPAGKDGSDGKDGDRGSAGKDGEDGKDGFPSESDWNDLVSRVEALEGEE